MPDDPAQSQMGELERLARARFPEPPLTEAETKVVRAVPQGETAVCGPNNDDNNPENNPATADRWNSSREIRSALIRWLCVNDDAKKLVDPKGIQIYGARILQPLDLSSAPVPFPLAFWKCRLMAELDVSDADLRGLDLGGSYVHSIDAEGTIVKTDVLLRDGFRSDDTVQLAGAHISDQLDCSGGTFYGAASSEAEEAHTAIYGDGLVVGDNVILSTGFHAHAGVRLLGARIAGQLDCSGGTFEGAAARKTGETPVAIDAEGITIGEDVFFSEGFKAKGEVSIPGSHIQGDLDCSAGLFDAVSAERADQISAALNAKDVSVAGHVSLNNGFHARGEVQLMNAHVGNLDCEGGAFENPLLSGVKGTGVALRADRIVVAGAVLFRQNFRANGEVRIPSAQIRGELDCSPGIFSNIPPNGERQAQPALNAAGASVGGEVLLSNGFIAEGEVLLQGIQTGGNLGCDGGSFKNPSVPNVQGTGVALQADAIVVARSVYLRQDFRAEGDVRLRDAQIGADLDCTGGMIGGMLDTERAVVKGEIFYRQMDTPEKTLLNFANTSAGILGDDEKSWPSPGKLALDGFVYGRIGEGPMDYAKRLDWLSRVYKFSAQPYRQLAKVLTESGDDDGAQKVLIELERRERLAHWWLERPWDEVMRETVGYGYRPLRALGGLAALTGIGWIIYRRALLAGTMTPSDEQAYVSYKKNGKPPANYVPFAPLIYSLENSLPLVKLGQADKWQPEPSHRSEARDAGETLPLGVRATTPGGAETGKTWMRATLRWTAKCMSRISKLTTSPKFLLWFLWIQILLGWIFATLFATGVTGIIHKD
jgi:cytoskeletal protein CcmA (bactofilin family)